MAHDGGAGEGARFRIVEAFGARPEFKVDVVDRVEKLDETGIRLVQRLGGGSGEPEPAQRAQRGDQAPYEQNQKAEPVH